MSGHSKWKTIKHKKGAADAKRGILFTKLAREITIAVKNGGGTDPTINYQLRLVIDKARSNNMPSDNIDRAVKRAGGAGDGTDSLEEITYEGYGPGGAAIILNSVTSNRNRTAAEVRSTFTKTGATLGESGCVSWNFETKGIITLDTTTSNNEKLALAAIDGGAEDVTIDDTYIEIYTLPETLQSVKENLESLGIPIETAELSMVPKTTVSLSEKEAEQTLRLLDLLEELDDSQKVYTNADFPDNVLEKYRGEI